MSYRGNREENIVGMFEIQYFHILDSNGSWHSWLVTLFKLGIITKYRKGSVKEDHLPFAAAQVWKWQNKWQISGWKEGWTGWGILNFTDKDNHSSSSKLLVFHIISQLWPGSCSQGKQAAHYFHSTQMSGLVGAGISFRAEWICLLSCHTHLLKAVTLKRASVGMFQKSSSYSPFFIRIYTMCTRSSAAHRWCYSGSLQYCCHNTLQKIKHTMRKFSSLTSVRVNKSKSFSIFNWVVPMPSAFVCCATAWRRQVWCCFSKWLQGSSSSLIL